MYTLTLLASDKVCNKLMYSLNTLNFAYDQTLDIMNTGNSVTWPMVVLTGPHCVKVTLLN